MGKQALHFGPMGRRRFLRTGVAGLGAMGLADLMRLRAQAAEAGRPRRDTAFILVWMDGGPSHLDTYDLKPEAPAEFRGQFVPIRTRVPDMHVCEHLPRHARLADKFTLIRSCSHGEGDHAKGAQYMLTGRTSSGLDGLKEGRRFPDIGSIVKWAGPRAHNGLPGYVGVPRRHERCGSGYLGMAHEPFEVGVNPNQPEFEVPNLGLPAAGADRLHDRMALLRSFDDMRQGLDQRGLMEAMDSYDQEAIRLTRRCRH